MEWGLPHCRTSLWGREKKKPLFWLCSLLFYVAGAEGDISHFHTTLTVSASHLRYTCPEGSTVKMVCSEKGATLHTSDVLRNIWLFTAHSDQHCSARTGPRHTVINSHGNHTLPPGLHFGSKEQTFWVILQNITHADQGRYCCMALDFKVDHQHASLLQKSHSHVILQVTPKGSGSPNCTFWDPAAPGGSVPVALAAAACVLALLSLPLILVLVYKQRQNGQSSRRAQELVRMDSEAQGYENPVFLGGSPQIKTRTVSQIMTRQTSETGRHLLSEPGTPLSPPAHGDVFFPTEDPIFESPELLQI